MPLWGMHMGTPEGAHYRSRLFSFFVARPPFGLPALMGALKGTHMHHPLGGALYNVCARVREARRAILAILLAI